MVKKKCKDIDEFISELEEESLVDYILDNGILQKKDFRGQFVSCLFHNGDNTPSMQVTDTFFKCYSCDAKGSIISFVMQYKGLMFMEAVSELAKYFGTTIENMRSVDTEKRSKIELEWANYLRNMENAPAEIKKMRKDYWPVEIGYDKDINYLVLPFTSKTGSILGFTKRVIGPVESGVRPKWKHSSFRDGLQNTIHNVFNLGDAISEINKTQTLIATEGPKDVIAYRRIGLQNTICVCGTSNSNNIWDLFPKLNKIILSYDGDDAGIHATITTVSELVKYFEISNIEMVQLPKGKDPYDITGEELKECYNNRKPVLDFVTKHCDKLELKQLFDNCMLHNRFKITSSACKTKGMSYDEVESWMNSTKQPKRRSGKEEEKEKLLAIVNGTDGQNHTLKEVQKATRLLKLKYKVKLGV